MLHHLPRTDQAQTTVCQGMPRISGSALLPRSEEGKNPNAELDLRSDLFSLGVTLYESATGEHPFINDEAPRGDVTRNILEFECVEPRRFNPAIPGPLCDVILRLLRKDRNGRYSDVQELQAALSAVVVR